MADVSEGGMLPKIGGGLQMSKASSTVPAMAATVPVAAPTVVLSCVKHNRIVKGPRGEVIGTVGSRGLRRAAMGARSGTGKC